MPDGDPLTGWAMAELACWRLNPADRDNAERTWTVLNATNPAVFLYRFAANQVSLADKPGKPPGGKPGSREQRYLAFFQSVAADLPANYQATVAMCVADKLGFTPRVPVFGFQKQRGDKTILMPDIDFLLYDFYRGDDVQDRLSYQEKTHDAVFVGATTGGMVTAEIARSCGLPRLRAAQFFHRHPRVVFLLPRIVQCVDQAARTALEALPFCRQQIMSWHEQLTRRFVISIDGNGATCSRVVVALHSNSVLLKYASEHVLYYFQGLLPWQHYVPIDQDSDVEKILDMDAWQPGALEAIARQGRCFARSYLTETAVKAYTRQLLLLYRGCLATAAAVSAEVPPDLRPTDRLSLVAHLEGLGDRRADPEGWVGNDTAARAIEGFAVAGRDPDWRHRVVYQAILEDGTMGEKVAGGEYCGTRGESIALHGFVLSVTPAAGVPDLHYQGAFADGTRSGVLAAGTVCKGASGAALVAMRIGILA